VTPPPVPLGPGEVRLYAGVLRAGDTRRTDSALLHSALRARSPALRRAAALAVGQLRATSLAPRLRALLTIPDTGTAAAAAFALGLLRDSASVAALAAALAPGSAVGSQAAWALGEIGPPARPAIAAALGHDHDSRVVAALLLAAAKLRPVPVSLIAPYLASSDPNVVRAAAYAIGRPRAPNGVRVLAALAGSGDAETRSYVARGLAISAAGDSLADLAFAALVRLARDASAHVRVSALASLGTYGARARDVVAVGVRDPDANVRVAAAQSLTGVLGSGRDDWAELWEADTAFVYRRALVTSAARAGVVLDAIDERDPHSWRRVTDWRYRAAAAAAGAGSAVERVRKLSFPLTRDPDGRVRNAAYAAFVPLVDSADADAQSWARTVLLAALDDRDAIVRATVLSALARTARPAEVPAVLESYRRAVGDTVGDARSAAIAFLAAAWRNDSAGFSDSLRAAVAALPPPADPLVWAAARGSSILPSWSARPAADRPLDWYAEIVRAVVVPTLAGSPPRVRIVTERGIVAVALYGADAPLTVYNFLTLARAGFYRGTRFHRVVPGFVAQDGDPRGDGNGGPGYAIRDELNSRPYDRGAVGMALSGSDTGGSQYFVTLSPQPHLDGHYPLFGHVTGGYDVLDRLVQGDRIVQMREP